MTASFGQILAGLNAAMGSLREEVPRRPCSGSGSGFEVLERPLRITTRVPYDLRGNAACIYSIIRRTVLGCNASITSARLMSYHVIS